MGKRKASKPQQLEESKRSTMSWNMGEGAPHLLMDPTESLDVATPPPGLFVDVATSLNAEEPEYSPLQQKIDKCDFYLTISAAKEIPKVNWICQFATFTIDINSESCSTPSEADSGHCWDWNIFVQMEEFWLYVSSDPECHLVYGELVLPSSCDRELDKVVMCTKAKLPVPYQCLEEMDTKGFKLLLSRVDQAARQLSVSICLLRGVTTLLKFPSEAPQKGKKVNKALQALVKHFYGLEHSDMADVNSAHHKDIEKFFSEVKEQREAEMQKDRRGEGDNVDVQHPALVPMLRPYQKQAVQWMLTVETSAPYIRNEVQQDTLHPLYEKVSTPDGKELYFNKYAGYLVEEKPRAVISPPGGILADEMGLGKTVEVLSCILCHPRGEHSKKMQATRSEDAEAISSSNSESKMTKENMPQENAETQINESSLEKTKKAFFDTSPIAGKTYFECLCGATSVNVGEKKVQCQKCNLWQHPGCVNFDPSGDYQESYMCPHCLVASVPVVSGATLIISPSSICHQWVEEIHKHIKEASLKVLVYTGVHKMGFIQPRTLAEHDIVITTYEVLRKEIDYVDLPHSNSANGRRFRHPKRFMAIPSPITAVEWWRVCLDEAQMVECTTTKTAEMALRLSSVNRWCVTGTPIQRDINDLYGLVLFLGVDPYWVLAWWRQLLYLPYLHGRKEPLVSIMARLLWRTKKEHVLDQIGLPSQREQMHWLTFLPVEEHFYRRQYRSCAQQALQDLRKWTKEETRLDSLDRHTLHKLLHPLVRLRQACCHPQAVRGEFLPIHKSTMTMKELLDLLVKKTRLECEEAHRQVVAALNGLAAIHIIKEQYAEAVETYRQVLQSVEEHKKLLRTDDLQLLHTMSNLQEILSTQKGDIPPTLRDSQLGEQISNMKEKYMLKAKHKVEEAVQHWRTSKEAVAELEVEIGEERDWWADLLHFALENNVDDVLIDKVKEDLVGMTHAQHLSHSFRDVRGLEFVMARELEHLSSAHTALVTALSELRGDPSQEVINAAVECCLRPTHETLHKCLLCQVDKKFEAYENKLFAFTDKGIEQIGGEDSGYQVSTQRQGTWADSSIETIIKSLASFSRLHAAATPFHDDGLQHIKLLEALKKEFRSMRAVWLAAREQVSALDELGMASLRLRVRLPDEPPADPPQPNILEPHQVDQHKLRLTSDRSVNKNDLTKKLGQLLYLNNLSKNQDSMEGGENPEPCPVCQHKLGNKWSVLVCGHCYCLECIKILVDQHSFRGRHRCLRCPMCRQSTAHADISYVCTKVSRQQENSRLRVKGDHSTKVEGVVQCLLEIQENDPDAKTLVFSTWTDVLNVIATALDQNGISFNSLCNRTYFQKSLTAFKEAEGNRVLLLPVHSGANGLNLVEATHVLLVEPILNPAQELQAVGRVHRIGQTRPTVVHRFIVRGTIEERMQEMLQLAAVPVNSHSPEETTLTISDLKQLFQEVEAEEDRER